MGFCRSVLDIPTPVHREQVRQLGDGRLPTPGDIVDLPEIPPLLSTRQRPCGLSPCCPCRLNGLGQISWDTHARRILEFRNELDRVGVDDFVVTPYMDPQWCVTEPGWVNEVGGIETWLATVPIVLFMYIRFHHVDRVKRQFGSEQAVPLDPVNLDGFIRASARDDDKWWPDELAYWYGFWHNRRSRYHQIQIVPTRYPGWPTREYADWCAVACRRRFLSLDRLLQDPRGAQLPDDVPPAATQERDPIVLQRDAPARGRRVRMQCPDIRRKGEGASTSGRSDTQPGGDHVDEEAEYRRHEDIPEGAGAQDPGGWPRDSRTERRLLLRRGYRASSVHPTGRGLWCRIRPHPPAGGPSGQFNRYGPPNDMYNVFSCGEQTMDHIAHEFIASRTSDDAVYRPGPPLQPHHDPAQQCQGFQYYHPLQQSYLQPSPQ
ncbi:hypothetical protein PIB30_093479 [Stylosanthes scabra]|uniref:Aminotransferase-like plant mobile domain-containing protein n=1 Tax=Stylosanthes scabra TaxID=79078 RepID=A0ABU6XXP4_9FABA|nr:hypothetical protein [Stylosanthes scabra]